MDRKKDNSMGIEYDVGFGDFILFFGIKDNSCDYKLWIRVN